LGKGRLKREKKGQGGDSLQEKARNRVDFHSNGSGQTTGAEDATSLKIPQRKLCGKGLEQGKRGLGRKTIQDKGFKKCENLWNSQGGKKPKDRKYRKLGDKILWHRGKKAGIGSDCACLRRRTTRDFPSRRSIR